jgi:hypothetical protein
VFFRDFAQIECGVALFTAQMSQVFRMEAEQVRKVRCRAGSKGKSPHGPLALDADQEMSVVDFIWAGYASGNYVTPRDILNYTERELRKCFTYS